MKKILLTLALGTALTGGYSQNYPTVTWAKDQGGAGTEVMYGITTDAAGNVYTTGLYLGTADLDPGSGTFNVTALGQQDVYITKLDANGNFVWGKSVGGTQGDVPANIAVDALGNVIVCGNFAGTADFDPGSATFNLTSAGAADGFVFKLDANGNFVWAAGIGSSFNEFVNGVSTDAAGNIYAAGIFTGAIDFDPGPGITTMTSAGGDDGFVVKYSPAGAFNWAKQLGTTGTDALNAIDVHSNGLVCAAGFFGGTLPAGFFNQFSSAAPCQGIKDGVVWLLTTAGVSTSGAIVGSATEELITAVTIDEAHNALYWAGNYTGTVGAPWNLTNSGGTDVFFSRVRTDANWIISGLSYTYGFGNAQAQTAKSLDVDPSGNVYMGGTINGTSTVDFDPRPFTYFGNGAGLDDAFAASYDSTGAIRFAFPIGNANTDFAANSIKARNYDFYVGGGFSGTVDFDPGSGTNNMTPVASYDGYAVKYNFCVAPAMPASTTPTANRTICSGTSATLTASGVGGGHISWYTAATGGTYLGSGSPFTTAPLTSTTTFYIQDSTCAASNNRESVTVTVNTSPTVTISSFPDPPAVCAGTQVYLAAFGAQTYAWSGGVVNNQPFTPTATTTYSVTGTASNGCTGTATVLVTVNQAPSLTITSNPSGGTICQGSSITLSGNGASTYAWSGGITNGVAFTPSASGTYTVTGTSASGCTATATTSVTVNTNPTITISSYPTTPTLCIGDTIYLTGNGANAMTWSGGVSDGDPFIPTATGTYTVTGTDGNGCSGTASITVTVNARPTVTASSLPSNGTVCAGDSVTLNGSGATSYTWSGGVSNGVAFVPSASGTYTVTGTAANGCTNTATQNVIVNSLPNVTIIAISTELCAGSATALNGNGASSYTWSGGVADGQPFAPTATTTYTVTGTDANGCSNTATETVIVHTLPTVTASSTPSNGAVCAGDNVTLNGGGATSYSWSGGVSDGVAFAPTASGTYTVIGTDANGCSNTATLNVTVNALPNVTITATNATVCAGNTTILSGNGASAYSWTGGVIDGQSFAPTATATYTVTGTDANGCSNTATQTVVVNTPPTADTASTNSACTSPTGSASVINVAGNGPFTYAWTNSTSTSSTASNLSAGVYVCTITDANGCSTPLTVIVNAQNAPNVVLQSVTNVSCFGGTDGAAVVNVTGGTGSYTYSWTNSSSTSNTIANVAAGTYTCTVTDAASCQANLIVTVTEPPALDNTVAASGMTLTSNETTPGATYQWVDCNNGNAPIAGATNASFTATQSGSYAVVVTLNTCSVTSTCVTVTGIASYEQGSISMYPNPNDGAFTVESTASGYITIFDVSGREVMTLQITAGKTLVLLNNQAKGVYLVRMVCGNHAIVQRMIVE